MFLELGELFGFPAGAALGQDALQQLRASLAGRVLSAPFSGERAFDGGFQQRLTVLLELLLRDLEFGHAGIEVGKQFLEFSDDAGLFGGWGKEQSERLELCSRDIGYVCRCRRHLPN